ncbi:hypothetical protein MP228_003094 [Amoeboaphelidium protococcarum]|nr:hypothetical protein MP228_003094 [Amoeboaphelidium protococcarum]
MGTRKKEKNRLEAEKGSGKQRIVKPLKGENFYRDAKKVKQVNMLKSGKPIRDSSGKITKPAAFQGTLPSGTVSRIQPDRRWFGNTRTIGQAQLDEFRQAINNKMHNPNEIILNRAKLPMSLLVDSVKTAKMNLLETDPFSKTFGAKSQRKRPKLGIQSLEEMAVKVDEQVENYDVTADRDLVSNKEILAEAGNDAAKEWYEKAGQSKRIWNELYKVIDSSDVIIQVLDARDPMGTRCKSAENFIKKECPHKHVILVLNKCDLVPVQVTSKWVKILSREYPTLAFHASINHSFGKGSLINLLRQFAKLHQDRKQISVGLIGYPNVGKSSIINTLKSKKMCNVAPVPGETKVWQYITLMRRIYLIDCPGVVQPNSDDDETSIVLKGVVRIENIINPENHIERVLQRVRKEHIVKTYGIESWVDSMDFLSQLAHKTGKLNRGAEPDVHVVSKMILTDWIRGKIPFFVPPPQSSSDDASENGDDNSVSQEVADGDDQSTHSTTASVESDSQPQVFVSASIENQESEAQLITADK